VESEALPSQSPPEIAGATSLAASESSAEPARPSTDSTQKPTESAPTLGSGHPIFEDRFRSQRTWPHEIGGPAWYQDTGYRLQARDPGRFVAVQAPVGPFHDVVVVGSFRKMGGPPGGAYGVIVRDGGPPPRDGVNQLGDYYVLSVTDRGRYGVFRREGDRWTDLVPYTPSDAVHTGTEPNDLVVESLGDRLTLTVNGTLVATLLGAEQRLGTVGVWVGGDFNDVLLSQFDVLSASSIGSANATAALNQEPDLDAPALRREPPQAPEALESEGIPATVRAPQGFTGALLREAPSISARTLASLPNGTAIERLPDTAIGDGFTWLRVRASPTQIGWVVSTTVAP
jgi:hypothetical protein